MKKMLWGQAREAQWRQAKAACVTGKKVAMIPGFLSECAHRLVVYHGLFIKSFHVKREKNNQKKFPAMGGLQKLITVLARFDTCGWVAKVVILTRGEYILVKLMK